MRNDDAGPPAPHDRVEVSPSDRWKLICGACLAAAALLTALTPAGR